MDVITTHINADFDCLGGVIAAKRLYPEAEMVFAGSQEPGVREFFLRGGLDPGRFRRLKEIDLAAVTRLILVDVRQSDRIGPFAEVARRPGVEVHIYDHHPAGASDLEGTLKRIEPVGATVTVFAEIFMERGIVPSAEEATLMLLGLYEDTGNLLFSSTTPRDYRAAAFLLEHGASLNVVADQLVQELTAEQVTLLHELVKSLTILNVNGIDIALVQASVDHFVGDLAVLTHKLRDMETLDAVVATVRMGDRVFIVGRSRLPDVPMGAILAEFGGGGHDFAASATVKDLTLVQVVEALPEIFARHVVPRWQARHLMSAPVKAVPREAPIREVRQILTRYNLNALPVMEGPRVVGIITRQVVDKAAHHGLAEVAVRELMSGEFTVLPPEASVSALQELIVERNQRFVPIVARGALVGAVTRTDLLRHLAAGVRGTPPRRLAGTGSPLKKRHIIKALRDQLPQRILDLLAIYGEVADELGVAAFVVGGFVRDLLLRQANLDIDLVIEGDGIAFAQACARRGVCRVRQHAKFGTAVLIYPDGFKVDVASARLEYYLTPGALPSVEHASIKLDLYRRDFTINTLAIALNEKDYGELVDFFGAQRDLEAKAVRVLHNLSFVEDPTRIFRAVRFEKRLGFRLGVQTEQLLRSAVRMGFLQKVSGARLFNELRLIFRENDPWPAVERLAGLGILKALHPTLAAGERERLLFERAARTIHWYDLLYIEPPCEHWLLYLLALFAPLARREAEGVCRRLELSPRYRELVIEQRAALHNVLRGFDRRQKSGGRPSASQLAHRLNPFAIETLLYGMTRVDNEEVRRWISHYVAQLRGVEALLDGHDLARLGIPPGPVYKRILATLKDARLNGRTVTREDEVALVRKRFAVDFSTPEVKRQEN